jgi:FixJ family two-component response regulator
VATSAEDAAVPERAITIVLADDHRVVRTVESHRAHIQQKTQRASRAELVAYAREHALL